MTGTLLMTTRWRLCNNPNLPSGYALEAGGWRLSPGHMTKLSWETRKSTTRGIFRDAQLSYKLRTRVLSRFCKLLAK
jgi:hypothetical protein